MQVQSCCSSYKGLSDLCHVGSLCILWCNSKTSYFIIWQCILLFVINPSGHDESKRKIKVHVTSKSCYWISVSQERWSIRVYGRPTYPGTEEAMAEDGDGGSPWASTLGASSEYLSSYSNRHASMGVPESLVPHILVFPGESFLSLNHVD